MGLWGGRRVAEGSGETLLFEMNGVRLWRLSASSCGLSQVSVLGCYGNSKSIAREPMTKLG